MEANSFDKREEKVFILRDWEKDTWERIYYKVDQKASFNYTIKWKDAKEGKFTNYLGQVYDTKLKIPKSYSSTNTPQ